VEDWSYLRSKLNQGSGSTLPNIKRKCLIMTLRGGIDLDALRADSAGVLAHPRGLAAAGIHPSIAGIHPSIVGIHPSIAGSPTLGAWPRQGFTQLFEKLNLKSFAPETSSVIPLIRHTSTMLDAQVKSLIEYSTWTHN
jgi:hypothetical protein